MSSSTVWEMESHTHAKHVILKKYLEAWIPIITTGNERVLFVDGFAGPGVYEGGEIGSPIIAIDALLNHSYAKNIKSAIHYYFIEEKRDRCDTLKSQLNRRFPNLPENIKYDVVNKEYAEAFTNILDIIENENGYICPTFLFIDPFGIKGLPIEILTRLMSHRRTEILINIMNGFLNRFLEHDNYERHCDALFGTREWRKGQNLPHSDKEIFLRELYEKQLRSKVGAKYISLFTMKNDRNMTIYDLYFATNSKRGIDKMKEAMWKVDTSGGYVFSDSTDPAQVTLFSEETNWDQLISYLCDRFSGQEVKWPVVEEAIRCSPFLIKKIPIKEAAKNTGSRLHISNPRAKQSNTLNDTALIRFD